MPLKRLPGVTPMSLANMVYNGGKAIYAKCEGCNREISIPVEDLYARGFTEADYVIDIGHRLRCSACGHKGAETRPDWRGAYVRSGERE